VSIAGIAPLDWMLDNTGPIARTVTDAAIALAAMQGPDPLDPVTATAPADAQRGPYLPFLKPGSLKGKRFGVPVFMMKGTSTPFHGTPADVPEWAAQKRIADRFLPLEEPTYAAFKKNLDELRAAGATIVLDDSILPDDFVTAVSRVGTYPYVCDGMQRFLKDFGPPQYRSIEDYMKTVGQPIGANVIGEGVGSSHMGGITLYQRALDGDPQAEANVYGPRRKAMAMYLETMDRLKLDAYVYPPIQMPPPDETMPQDGEVSDGPHSDTGWVNMLGLPAVVVSGGFYPGGLPVGLEFSGRPWRDGDLLGIAYGFEQATHHRHPPVLVEQGLLPKAP
jgi:amidase